MSRSTAEEKMGSTKIITSSLFILAAAVGMISPAHAAITTPVTDFHAFNTTSITLTDGDTNHPTFGSFTPGTPSTAIGAGPSAYNGFVVGYFPTITLANVGDYVTFSFNVQFNDDLGMGTGGDNFRFGLFDIGSEAKVTAPTTVSSPAGTTATDGFRGYYVGTTGTGSGSGGSTRERTAGSSTNIFTAADTVSITDSTYPSGGAVTFVSSIDSNGAGEIYTGSLTVTRTAAGNKITGSFTDPNPATGTPVTVTFSGTDSTTATWPSNFSALGFLNGTGVSADQLIFSNVAVSTNVPEPTTLTLLATGITALTTRRRRST